jgi:hypothetical protein
MYRRLPLAGILIPFLSFAQMPSMNEAGMYLMSMASGTSQNPDSWPMPMLMSGAGAWNLMFMGQAFLVDTQQSGPRGGDKLYSPNAFMFSASHSLAGGTLQFQSMISLEPLTITGERYPELFQTGETAYGRAIVDGQHPHNFLMGVGVDYAHSISGGTLLQFYYAPVGDPALGPVAYPHRASAEELPQAPLSHHWQDSTHISADVASVAVKHSWFRLEASGFHGAEPGENRWKIPWGAMDSWAGRLSIAPSSNWTMQVSAGRITHPEPLSPGDVIRTTASISYSQPVGGNEAWSTSLIWGRNHDTDTGHNLNSYLLETVYPFRHRNFLTSRIEYVDKDELFADTPALAAQLERTAGSTFRIGAYTAGYTRDIGTCKMIETGFGANASVYTLPAGIKPYYSDRPWGVNVFLRVRLKPGR